MPLWLVWLLAAEPVTPTVEPPVSPAAMRQVVAAPGGIRRCAWPLPDGTVDALLLDPPAYTPTAVLRSATAQLLEISWPAEVAPSRCSETGWLSTSAGGRVVWRGPLAAGRAVVLTSLAVDAIEIRPGGAVLVLPRERLGLVLDPLDDPPLALAEGLFQEAYLARAGAGAPEVHGGALVDPRGTVVAASRAWPEPLPGPWRFRLDPRDVGLVDGWLEAAFDDREWRPIAVGANWETVGYDRYDGIAWYRRRLRLPPEIRAGGGELRIGGIDDNSTVWVDGRDPVRTTGWQTPIRVRLPARREFVVIAIRVEDTGGGGGAHGAFELTVTPP